MSLARPRPRLPSLLAGLGLLGVTGIAAYEFAAVPTATWYQLWVATERGRFAQWYTAAAPGCESADASCRAVPDTDVDDAGAGQWWVRTWSDTG